MGEARRHRRRMTLRAVWAGPPPARRPLASGDGAEANAAYRGVDHPARAWRDRLAGHHRRPGEWLPGPPVVRWLPATPEAAGPSPPGLAGRGRLRYAARPGLDGPPPRVVTPTGVALGVLAAWRWAREPPAGPPGKARPRGREGSGEGGRRGRPGPGAALGGGGRPRRGAPGLAGACRPARPPRCWGGPHDP